MNRSQNPSMQQLLEYNNDNSSKTPTLGNEIISPVKLPPPQEYKENTHYSNGKIPQTTTQIQNGQKATVTYRIVDQPFKNQPPTITSAQTTTHKNQALDRSVQFHNQTYQYIPSSVVQPTYNKHGNADVNSSYLVTPVQNQNQPLFRTATSVQQQLPNYGQGTDRINTEIKPENKKENPLCNSRTSMKTVQTVQSSQTQYVYYTQPSSQPYSVKMINQPLKKSSQQQKKQVSYNQINRQFQLKPTKKPVKPAVVILNQEQKIRKLELELQQLKIQNIEQTGNPQEQLQQYQQKLQEERQKFSDYQDQFQQKTGDLEKVLRDLRVENTRLKDQNQNQKQQESDNIQYQARITSLEQQNQFAIQDKIELEKKLNLEQAINSSKDLQFRQELEETKNRFENRLVLLNEQIESKEKSNDQDTIQLRQDLIDAQMIEKQLQNDKFNLEQQIIDIQRSNDILINELNALKQADNSLQEKETQIQEALEQQYSQVISQNENELNILRKQNSDYLLQINQIQKDSEKLLADSQIQKKELENQVESLQNKSNNLEENLKLQEQQQENLNTQNKGEKQQIKDSYEQLLQDERQNKESMADKYQQEIQGLQEEIRAQQQAQQDLEAEQQEKVLTLESQIKAQEKEIQNQKQLVQDNQEEVKDMAQKIAIQEDIRKEQEDQFKKLLKQKEVELQIIHDDFEQKFKSAFLEQSFDLNSQKEGSEINSNLLKQSFKKTEKTKLNDKKSKKSKKTSKTQQPSKSANLNDNVSARSITTSQRSKQETRSMYKKMSQMSMATAAMMSSKMDYQSLKELTQSNEEMQEEIQQAQQAIIEEHKQYNEEDEHQE